MSLFDVYSRYKISPQKGEGSYIYCTDNKKYLDLYGGHGVISIGHNHPNYTKRLKQQVDQISFYSNAVEIDVQQELSIKIKQLSGYSTYSFFMCNSGAEANENALKLASFHNEKRKVIAFKKGFHGRTTGALNVTHNQSLSPNLCKANFPVEFLSLNDYDALNFAFSKKDIAAVIIEGIQGVGGLDYPTPTFLKQLSALCTAHNVILILDEIQSGYGRTGAFFAHQHAGIEPDIITIAKGMGNGFPVAGLLIHPKIEAKKGMLGTTFGGNYLACAAALSVVETLETEKVIEQVNKKSDDLVKALKKIPEIKRIKGQGLMLGVEFDFPIKTLREKLLYTHHIVTGGSANPKQLRILPPLTISKEALLEFPKALTQALKK